MMIAKVKFPFDSLKERSSMKLLSVQNALFFENPIARPDKYVETINSAMDNVFKDVIPLITPLPEGAPLEMPIVQIATANNLLNVNIARNRADFFLNYNFKMPVEINELLIRNYVQKFYRIICESIGVVRMGIIYNLFIEDSNGAKTIAEKYFKNSALENAVELEFRTNVLDDLDGAKLNNLTNIGIGKVTDSEGNDSDGILILRDINNCAVDGRKLTICELDKLFEFAANDVENALVKELL